jgi:alpha-beta hydrolase superfamily lysophospholipase
MRTPRVSWLALLLALAFSSLAAAAPARKHEVNVDGFALTVWERSARKPGAAILLVHGIDETVNAYRGGRTLVASYHR